MSESTNIILAVKSLENILSMRVEEAKSFYMNESNDIGERWSVFLAVEKYLEIQPYIVHLKALEVVLNSWYDDFYITEGSTVIFTDVVERIVKNNISMHAGWSVNDVDMDALRAEMMSLGIRGFVFDT